MAKRKTVNRSDEVRKYLATHPDSKPSAVAQALKEFKVTPGLVSNIKTRMKMARRKKKVAKPPSSGAPAQRQLDDVVAAARLIRICGGVKEAKQALDMANQVADALK